MENDGRWNEGASEGTKEGRKQARNAEGGGGRQGWDHRLVASLATKGRGENLLGVNSRDGDAVGDARSPQIRFPRLASCV